MKRRKINDRSRPDFYSQRAKKAKYSARSVYKLDEIQKKYRLIRSGDAVLDLGCAPGSWLQYAADITGKKGRIAGIDLKAVTADLPDHVRVYTGDVLEMDEELKASVGKDYDLVMSDMAPSTTGKKNVDAARSYVLCEAALDIAQQVVKPGGRFVAKIFQGEDFEDFITSVRLQYDTRKIFKPQSCRKDSKEIYVIGMGKK